MKYAVDIFQHFMNQIRGITLTGVTEGYWIFSLGEVSYEDT